MPALWSSDETYSVSEGSLIVHARALYCIGLLLAVAGCQATDPYRRIGAWRPNHANTLNLAMMVANPADLLRGTGDGSSSGQQAVTAIDRLRSGRVKPLPDSGLAKITLTGSGAAAPAGAASGDQ